MLAGDYTGRVDPQQHSRKLAAIPDAGAGCVVDLTDLFEGLPRYADVLRFAAQGAAIQCQRFPIEESLVPEAKTMRRILDAVDTALNADDTVYLHCLGGIEVMARRQRSPDSPETPEQREFIAAWGRGLARPTQPVKIKR